MNLSQAKKQTLQLTVINGVVRALGLLMRVLLSRIAGAEVMGVMELAQSVHMIAIAPVTSGLPAAITRLTAKASKQEKPLPLQAGLWLTRRISVILIPLLWLLSPIIAQWTGDARVLPSLWFTAPCVLVLGYSACINGYCYGLNRSNVPAVSELIEQIIRVCLTLTLIRVFRFLTVGWMAALPAASTLIAEIVGLLYAFRSIHLRQSDQIKCTGFIRPVLELSYPSTINRLMQTLLRSLTSIAIPIRLQQSGLTAAEATSRLGMLNGMVMPILMLPCIFTSALSMVALPKMTKAENQPSAFKRLILRCLMVSTLFSVFCAFAVYGAAPVLAAKLYRLPELSVLFRTCCGLTILTAMGHVLSTALSALGQQKNLLWISSLTSAVSLMLTWLWAGDPAMRINGVILSQFLSSLLAILLSCICLIRRRADDKSA